MKKVFLLALLVLASATAEAQDYLYGLPMYRGPVSAMGACEATKPRLWVTTDSSAAGNCAAGSGSAQVLCLCSGGAWAAVGGSGTIPQHIQDYSPDRAPATCYACEEFTDGALSQTWTWGNQASATDTLEMDGARINYSGATGRTVRWTASPGASNWTVSAKFYVGFNTSSTNECIGLAILESGTIGSPSAFREFVVSSNGGDAWRLYGLKLSGYSTYVSTDTTVWALDDSVPVYLQARYTTATKALVWAWSLDGRYWTTSSTLTLAANPTYIGRQVCTAASVGAADFFRIRTDANRNLAGE